MKTMDTKKDDASEDEGQVRTRRRRRAMTNNDERNKKNGPRDVDNVFWAIGMFFLKIRFLLFF